MKFRNPLYEFKFHFQDVIQINNFLKEQNNFQLNKFDLIKKNIKYSKLLKNNFMFTLPNTIKKNSIDGYFAAYLKRIK